ncbi:MAG: MerR family transcriptional regulator [Pseudomonadota bacterium]
MAEKSRDAFRTISEVADWLDVPTHVLRFWESRFSQIKPVKRAGGRRYYRPSDMRVIGGVKVLLHDQGMTIRGVQKLFREEGIKHVSGYAPDLFAEDEEVTPQALNEEALERAARPASAARSTRGAEPDPDVVAEAVEDAPPAGEAEVVEEDVPPLFRRAQSTPPPTEPPATAEEPAADPAPSIPATPDVPAIDIPDTDPSHAKAPGFAAQLKLASPNVLIAHKALLNDAASRLRAVIDRAE